GRFTSSQGSALLCAPFSSSASGTVELAAQPLDSAAASSIATKERRREGFRNINVFSWVTGKGDEARQLPEIPVVEARQKARSRAASLHLLQLLLCHVFANEVDASLKAYALDLLEFR